MPKISVENYDTVAAWNGSQDLFVVEQPDGTKVATPAMVKQFIEAGDFEATGEVKDGHGNVLNDMANVLGFLSFTHFVQIPFTTSVLDSIKAAFENDTIPVDIYGITLGIVRGGAGSQRVIVIAQNQKLSTTQTRYAAIYFGAYTAPRFCQKQDGSAWTDVVL